MRLRGRFVLWFALAALVPIAAAALVTREIVSSSYVDDFAALERAAKQAPSRALAAVEKRVLQATKALANRRHDFVGGLLLELEKSDGEVTPDIRRGIRERGGPLMAGWGLDVLYVLDGKYTVLAAPHYRPARGKPRNEAKTPRAKVFYGYEAIIENNEVVQILVAMSARTVREGQHRLTVIGGQRIGPELIDQIRLIGKVGVRIVDTAGNATSAAKSRWPKDQASARYPLPGKNEKPVAWIETRISDRELQMLLDEVTHGSIALAGVALFLMLLLGIVVARRMTRNLDKLTSGADAAARGDLDHRIVIRTKDEIGQVAKALNRMMRDLRASKEKLVIAERIAAWQEIARRLAHEIKNPLTPIRMSVDTMRKTWARSHPSFAEIFEESTTTILEETSRLKRIVSEFSEFARSPKPKKAPCEINSVIASSLSLYKETIPIEQDLAEDLPTIFADRDQLTQVILNLLENAREAISAEEKTGGSIAVASRYDGNVVKLIVTDNGPGLSDKVMNKLFTPYFTTKHAGSGTGLGLAIVHRIISDHGGAIRVENVSTGGARFIVSLPVGSEQK